MKVYIDSREQNKINQILSYWKSNSKKFPHIEDIEIKKLATSDLATDDGNIGIERKSSKDFVESFCSDRLKQQLYELRSNYKTPLLLVEDYDGMMDCITKNPQLHPNVIKGVVTSAFAHNGVSIQFVGPFYIPFSFELIEKSYDGKRQEYENIGYRPLRRAFTKDDIKKNVLIGLPYVDEVISSRLLKTFDNSIKKIMEASLDDLQKVPGIGLERAKQIKEIFS